MEKFSHKFPGYLFMFPETEVSLVLLLIITFHSSKLTVYKVSLSDLLDGGPDPKGVNHGYKM